MVFRIKKGDDGKTLRYQLKKNTDGTTAAVNITGATVLMWLRKVGSTTPLIDGRDVTSGVTTAASGLGAVSFTSTDTATPGNYALELQVTYSGGTIETFPENGYVAVSITEDLD